MIKKIIINTRVGFLMTVKLKGMKGDYRGGSALDTIFGSF